MNKNNYVLISVVFLLIVISAYFVFMRNSDDSSEIMEQKILVNNEDEFMTVNESIAIESDLNNESITSEDISQVKVFEVMGSNFAFSPNEIRVNQGDRVKIVFTSQNGFHDFVLDEFDAKTSQMNSGGSETIEFVADKVGNFEYYCSVGNHRQMGMVGKLIVE